MLRPLLLIKVGVGGLAFAARLGQGTQTPQRPALEGPAEPAATASPAEPAESAGAFLRRHLEQELTGQFGRSWDELHPAHQQVVSRERYARCRSELYARVGSPGRLEAFEVLGTEDEPIRPAGIPETISKAVTVRLRIGGYGSGQTAAETLHAIPVSGRWTWILSDSAYGAYEAGSHPGAKPSY
jgi:hypothetical protein